MKTKRLQRKKERGEESCRVEDVGNTQIQNMYVVQVSFRLASRSLEVIETSWTPPKPLW
jgi:hypothetical protein